MQISILVLLAYDASAYFVFPNSHGKSDASITRFRPTAYAKRIAALISISRIERSSAGNSIIVVEMFDEDRNIKSGCDCREEPFTFYQLIGER